MVSRRLSFPPRPRGLKGRATELATLARMIETAAPARLALVGGGGSGKSMLAAALAYRLASRFGGRLDWFRVGAWDFRTLAEMLALRFGTPRDRHAIVHGLAEFLRVEERLIVLDNHEDDAATARLLEAFAGTKATFVVTARRCLLGGVLVYPVTAPLAMSGRSAFPRVAKLTRRLRFSPLALAIADAIVGAGDATEGGLASFLDAEGIGTVRVIAHEDDLPEVAGLVAWAWARLSAESRRMLGVLAHSEGDHVDIASLARLARVSSPKRAASIATLHRWNLVQEIMPGRLTVHAVVRYAVQRRTKPMPAAFFDHYVALLEREPARFDMEQSHLFAAMDQAHRRGEIAAILRVDSLLERLASEPG